MDYRITADDRARFKRCRRQWDYGSPNRRDLEPDRPVTVDLFSAIKDALAAFYYPGTWDWPREIVLPLVHKAFLRSVRDQAGPEADCADVVAAGTELLEQYLAWAPALDCFAPIKIDHDVEGLLPDPREPDRGLLTPGGNRVIYTCRIDLLAVDAADEYWVVSHQLVSDWQEADLLALDEHAVAACWAWEQEYLGMEIAGTIHDQMLTNFSGPPAPGGGQPSPLRVAQNEASGGGRSIPQHRRLYARPRSAGSARRTVQRSAGPIRRTQIRRDRTEIAAAGRQLGEQALVMVDAGLAAYPSPAQHCLTCDFRTPCLAQTEGADPDAVLAAHYRRREHPAFSRPRLGQTTWSVGRGAAPPPNW